MAYPLKLDGRTLAYRMNDRPGLWRLVNPRSEDDRRWFEMARRQDKLIARPPGTMFGKWRNRFVRWWELERIYSEALGREIVDDRHLMFCDRCGDSTRAVVQFEDGVLCRDCAKGE